MIRNRLLYRVLSTSGRSLRPHSLHRPLHGGTNGRPWLVQANASCSTRIRFSSTESSIDDSSIDWIDWFRPGPRNSCPWDRDPETAWLQPLHHDEPLDYQTRHAIQLLQDLYKSGGRPPTMDVMTTNRCNTLLEKLLDTAPSSSSSVDNGARHRADALLQAMQLFDAALSARLQPQHQQQKFTELLPHPDIDSFNLVLRLFASSPSTTRAVPDRALEICHALQYRYETLGDISCRPNPFHYNCVLNAWRTCRLQDGNAVVEDDFWEKPVHAAHVLVHDMDRETRDSSSFIALFKICADQREQVTVANLHSATPRPNNDGQAQQAKQLGGLVAIKVWQEVIEDDSSLDLKSHVYTHFLQAIRNIVQINPLRAEYYQRCFQRAIDHGKVNSYLINELLVHCKDPMVLHTIFGHRKKRVNTDGMTAGQASQAYLAAAPDEWKRNADK